jgi:hypothetical protein
MFKLSLRLGKRASISVAFDITAAVASLILLGHYIKF